jgi:uncharacterized membrane-anchored protein YitT (DUF2179 family)
MAVGSAVMSFGISALIVPNRLADGGLTGVVIVLHDLTGLGVGPLYAALNAPLLAWAWRSQGTRFVWRTLLGVALVSFWTTLFAHVPPPVRDRLLAALYGGLCVGVGVGLVLRAGGSTGGSDILARHMDVYHGWAYARTMVAVDLAVLTAVGLLIGLPAAMYAWIGTHVAGAATSYIVEGGRRGRLAVVVTGRPQQIARRVADELGHGATLLQGRGGESGAERPVVLTAVGERQVVKLRTVVAEEDAAAFVVLLPAVEVRGEGFLGLTARHPL